MRKSKMIAGLLAAAMAAPALAQGGSPPDPYGGATVGKAEVRAQAAARFARLDTNKNNSLSSQELRAGVPGGGGGPGGPPPGAGGPGGPGAQGPMGKNAYVASEVRQFEMQDANKDGRLTKAERDAFRRRMMQRFQGGGQ